MSCRLGNPLTLSCGQTLNNRIAKAALSEQLGDKRGAPTKRLLTLYQRWGEGGAGLLISGNVMIDRTALGEPRNVVLDEESDLAPFQAWADIGQRTGSPIWLQLNHPGRQSPRNLSPEPVAPSAVPMATARAGFRNPRALEDQEIEQLIERFATSAGLAKQAGFAGIQIHGAHGYLVSQFLSPHTNRRDDRWGGSLSNRTRFLMCILRAVRQRVGPDFAIGLKLNSSDFQRGGFTHQDAIAVVRQLDKRDVDLLEISGGTYERTAMWGDGISDSTREREAYFVDYARDIRAATDIPVMLTGGFRSATAMQGALESNATDVIGVGRPLILEPDLPARLISGESREATAVRAARKGTLGSALEGSWYQAQLLRLAKGKQPNARAGRCQAWRMLLRTALSGNAAKRGHHRRPLSSAEKMTRLS